MRVPRKCYVGNTLRGVFREYLEKNPHRILRGPFKKIQGLHGDTEGLVLSTNYDSLNQSCNTYG